MNIGTNIYTLRKEKKITQAQLAEKLGVSEQAVSKWENDQCSPDVSLFPIIADYFGVSMEYLLTGKNETDPALSFEEESIISAYRLLDDGQKDLVCKMLGIKRDLSLSKEGHTHDDQVS